MMFFSWDEKKNRQLKIERGVCFEQVSEAIENNNILDLFPHPNTEKYPRQQVFIVSINNYAYVVPHISEDENIFLKTIIPSRKMTKKYINFLL